MDDVLRYRDDAAHEEPAVTLDAFLGQTNATAVRPESDEDARALIPHLDRLALIEVLVSGFATGAAIRRGDPARAGHTANCARPATCSSTRSCRCAAAASTLRARQAARSRRGGTRARRSTRSIRRPPTAAAGLACGMAEGARIRGCHRHHAAVHPADADDFVAGMPICRPRRCSPTCWPASSRAGSRRCVVRRGVGGAAAHGRDIDRDVPVIFTNTQKMFGETLAYATRSPDAGADRPARLSPRSAPARRERQDRPALVLRSDGCCAIRKVEPLQRALAPFDAWISGRKGFRRAPADPALRDRHQPHRRPEAQAQPARRLGQAAARRLFR